MREPEEFEAYVQQFVAGAFPGRHLMVLGRDSVGKSTLVRKVLPDSPVIKATPLIALSLRCSQ